MTEKYVVASHQPHFFPWLGYFDKMAKADLFLINDVAQIELNSPMRRNKIINQCGSEQFISVAIDKEGFKEKENREIRLKEWDKCRETIKAIIENSYRKSCYFGDVWPQVKTFFSADYEYLFDLQMATINLGRKCCNISTPLMFHSSISYEDGTTTSERLAKKLSALGASIYLSGNGARKYMDDADFIERKITVVYQTFSYPNYRQLQLPKGLFVPNMSFLDLLFNEGIENARKIFWRNVDESIDIQEILRLKAIKNIE